MTWAKFGDGFADDAAAAGLSDTAFRTHAEAIMWLFRVEDASGVIPKRCIPRFAGSDHYEDGIRQLVALEWWRDTGSAYIVVRHGDVIPQSLNAQKAARERNRRAQQAWRDRQNEDPSVSADISAYGENDGNISAYVSAPPIHANKQAFTDRDGFPQNENLDEPNGQVPDPMADRLAEMERRREFRTGGL